MRFELERLVEYDNASIIAEMRRVAALVPAPLALTKKRFSEHSKVSSDTVIRRFNDWQEALHVAGLAGRYCGRAVTGKMKTQVARGMTSEQLVAEMRRVAAELQSDTLTTQDFNSRSRASSKTVSLRLGSWNKALRAAGLRPVNMGRRHSEDDYFENLLTVWTHFGRQPKYREMDSPPSVIGSGGYEKRWGTWTKALLAFLDKVNSDRPLTPARLLEEVAPLPSKEIANPKPENERKIALGLRYNILRRDHFKCVLCGNSPATDTSCKLHVDHLLPSSKGGKTVEENLRTLCGHCNIGKADKMEVARSE